MEKQEKALALFDNKFNCAQSVLASFADVFNMHEDDLLRVSCAFGGGIGKAHQAFIAAQDFNLAQFT